MLLTRFNTSPFIRTFLNDCSTGLSGKSYYQLNLTTKSILVSLLHQITKEQKDSKRILLITTDDSQAEDFLEDISLLCGKEDTVLIPDFETLPYEDRSPHSSIRGQRLEGLTRILENRPSVVIASVKTMLRIILPPQILEKNLLIIRQEEEYDLDVLCSKLISIGYSMEYEVTQVGEIARRGGILDIYSPSAKQPVRLEFFGDAIASCRYFEPQTQRSTIELIGHLKVIPVREIVLDDIATTDSKMWDLIHEKGLYEGIEQDVSLLYEQPATLYDYLSDKNSLVIFDDYPYLETIAEEIIEEATELYLKKSREKGKNRRRTLPPVDKLFIDFRQLSKRLRQNQHLFFSNYLTKHPLLKDALEAPFSAQTPINNDLAQLKSDIKEKLAQNWQIVIQSDNKSQSKRMQTMLVEYEGEIDYTIGVFHRGFNLEDCKIALFTDHEVFNRYKQKRFQEYFSTAEAIIDYNALKPGDYIVHIDHGIGIYEGLSLMEVNGNKIECLTIRYADEAKVYVPTFQLKLVSRYIADEGISPEINKLGSKKWDNIKSRAKKQIELIADDLVKLYAERSTRSGIPFDPDNVWQTELEESFIFEDTPDQKRATEEIKLDMEKANPMERLLCGDVGFGKTEVAIRAAFKAVVSGWQVAVLVPTTLLAEQHYLVFKERLAQYPVEVTMFSRFRSSTQIKKDIVRLGNGEIDIAIGTHRLISQDVRFQRLGLLIIDEEHRFGVRHKEKLRKLKSNVDTLYMSATPIPRTLSMALSRFKELSLMQTSPKARLPIRTLIIHYDREVIKDAMLREMDRGGQVLFVHNRVETIESIAQELREMLPKARIVVGHGQLPERLLENVMLDFYAKNFDILVATTIIESGIDVPNANTIIVNRADMFGLAQLYQIRGRVGRSNRRAYAYFVIPKHLNLQARKRLEALTEYNTLGAGYQIAMRDLELRGAGSLLGTKQSGVIQSIGFNYYNRLLSEAVDSLLQTPGEIRWQDEELDRQSKLRIDADFFFPDSYINDEKTKLSIYQKMLGFSDPEDFVELEEELEDRFGQLPAPAARGIRYYKLKLLVDQLPIDNFRVGPDSISFNFPQEKIPGKTQLEKVMQMIDYPVSIDATQKRLKLSISLQKSNDSEINLSAAEKLVGKLRTILA